MYSEGSRVEWMLYTLSVAFLAVNIIGQTLYMYYEHQICCRCWPSATSSVARYCISLKIVVYINAGCFFQMTKDCWCCRFSHQLGDKHDTEGGKTFSSFSLSFAKFKTEVLPYWCAGMDSSPPPAASPVVATSLVISVSPLSTSVINR